MPHICRRQWTEPHTLYPPGTVHTLRLRALGEVGCGRGFLPQLSKEALDEISHLPGHLPRPGPVQATLWGEPATPWSTGGIRSPTQKTLNSPPE